MAHYGPGMRGHSLSRAHVAARPARGWADGAAARLIGLDPSDGGVGLPVEAQSQCLAGTCAGDPCRSDTPAKLRSRAIITVALIEGPAASDVIAQFVGHKDPVLRGAAAEAIGNVAGTSSDAALNILLKDADANVRYRALASLAMREGEKAWPVVETMTKSMDRSVAQWGSKALALVGTEEALRRLADLSRRHDFRAGIARGVHGVSNPKLIGMLLRILSSTDPRGKEYAAGMRALRQFDKEDILRAMKSGLTSGDRDAIRSVALIASVLETSQEIGDLLRQAAVGIEDTGTIRSVLSALGRNTMSPNRHSELFEKFLNHSDTETRELAIRGLAHCRGVNLYEQLRPSLEDKSTRVVEAALSALRRAPVRNAPKGKLIDCLKTCLESAHEGVQTKACDLLAHAGTAADFEPAMELLGERLLSKDQNVRGTAADVLGRLAPVKKFETIVRKQGYVSQWMILGTFLNDKTNSGFDKVFPPEEAIDFDARYTAKYVWVLGHRDARNEGELEREIGWTETTVDQADGKLSIPQRVPPPAALAIAYAVADFNVEKEQEVLLTIDGDDAFRVWFNGKKISEQAAEYKRGNPCVAEQKDIKIKFRAGVNRFLVKTANIDREWWVRLRLSDSQGRPVGVKP